MIHLCDIIATQRRELLLEFNDRWQGGSVFYQLRTEAYGQDKPPVLVLFRYEYGLYENRSILAYLHLERLPARVNAFFKGDELRVHVDYSW